MSGLDLGLAGVEELEDAKEHAVVVELGLRDDLPAEGKHDVLFVRAARWAASICCWAEAHLRSDFVALGVVVALGGEKLMFGAGDGSLAEIEQGDGDGAASVR